MKMGGLTLTVNMEQLDEAKEKANQLKATLEECQQLIDSLSGRIDKPLRHNCEITINKIF
jgi:hypothetical protein